MTASSTSSAVDRASRPGLANAHLVLAALIPLLVLVQAALAGQSLFEGSSITLHGILGNITFTLTIVSLVFVLLRNLPGQFFALAVALMALAFAQVGLGYVGRETSAAAAWHIPNGVAIIAVASFQLALVAGTRPPRAT